MRKKTYIKKSPPHKKNDRNTRESIIILFRNHGDKSFRAKEIASLLGLRNKNALKNLYTELNRLVESGKIKKDRGNRFSLAKSESKVAEGILSITRNGHGYLIVEGQEQDVFIHRNRINGAMNKDKVRVRYRPRIHPRSEKGSEVIEILERANVSIVATYKAPGLSSFVVPDDNRLGKQIYVHPEDRGAASAGDKVLVQLKHTEEGIRALVTEVIGPADDPGVQVLSLVHALDLPVIYPEEALIEADRIQETIPEEAYTHRLDLRHKRIFTIDPVDAKDFDDAIHIEKRPDGGFELGVHIADVSHYVTAGGAIDQEAYRRATSIYLVDRVIPMLPERLSNEICSLRPNEEKLAFSCIMQIDAAGVLTESRFAETIIHSVKRFTYEEAQAILDNTFSKEPCYDDLSHAMSLSKTLIANRFKEGSVDFETPEVKVKLDEAGYPIAIERKERLDTHRLIEECMLMANKAVALELAKRQGKKGPAGVYRIHESPDSEQISKLITYVQTFGVRVKTKEGKLSSSELNKLLEAARDLPAALVIKMAALRAMAKAKYSTQNKGHYGLGFSHYTHFTSPIRRYPDLLVHRLLKKELVNQNQEALEAQCEYCSGQERKAEEAERNSIKLKQIQLIADKVGEVFDGLVVSATSFGLFIQLDGVYLEGLLHIRDMNDDYYEYDEQNYKLVGSHSGKAYRPGDRLRVQLAGVDTTRGEVDLVFPL